MSLFASLIWIGLILTGLLQKEGIDMKKCPYCGWELDDEARACDNCGRPLPGAAGQNAASPEGADSDKGSSDSNPGEGMSEGKRNQDGRNPNSNPNEQNNAGNGQFGWNNNQNGWNPGQGGWNTNQNGWNPGQGGWNTNQNGWNPGQGSWNTNPGQAKTNPFAVSALAVGIASIFFQLFVPFLSVIALCLGIVGFVQIRNSNGMYKGKRYAIAAIILGVGITITYLILMVIAVRMMQTPEFSQYMKEIMKEYESIMGSSSAASSGSTLISLIRRFH